MSTTITPHLNLPGTAREALEFYRDVFDGQLVLVSYTDIHMVERPEEADNIAWGQVESADGPRIMAYDVRASQEYERGVIPFFVALRGTDADRLATYWERLAEGGTVLVPFGPSSWSPLYGMVADRFGITWVVDQAVEYAG